MKTEQPKKFKAILYRRPQPTEVVFADDIISINKLIDEIYNYGGKLLKLKGADYELISEW